MTRVRNRTKTKFKSKTKNRDKTTRLTDELPEVLRSLVGVLAPGDGEAAVVIAVAGLLRPASASAAALAALPAAASGAGSSAAAASAVRADLALRLAALDALIALEGVGVGGLDHVVAQPAGGGGTLTWRRRTAAA